MNVLQWQTGKFTYTKVKQVKHNAKQRHCSFFLPCDLQNSLHIVGLCTILSPQNNFEWYNTPSSRQQRQWLKYLLFDSTIFLIIAAMHGQIYMTMLQNREIYTGFQMILSGGGGGRGNSSAPLSPLCMKTCYESVQKAKSGYGNCVRPSTIMTA